MSIIIFRAMPVALLALLSLSACIDLRAIDEDVRTCSADEMSFGQSMQFSQINTNDNYCVYGISAAQYGCKLDQLSVAGNASYGNDTSGVSTIDSPDGSGPSVSRPIEEVFPLNARIARLTGIEVTPNVTIPVTPDNTNATFNWFANTTATPIACNTANCAVGTYHVSLRRPTVTKIYTNPFADDGSEAPLAISIIVPCAVMGTPILLLGASPAP